MTTYIDAIADIGETLITLLRDEFLAYENIQDPAEKQKRENDLKNEIVLFSPGELDVGVTPPRLCLFLYQVSENPYLKNMEMNKKDEKTLKYPDLVLDLHYMMIPYEAPKPSGEDAKTERTKAEHHVLALAMQIFHNNGILRDPILKGGLTGKGLNIRLTTNPVPLDEMTKLWQAFQSKPYRPSICYVVSPIIIESGREIQRTRITQGETVYGQS